MQLGIVTPVVTRLPGAHAQWEEGAGIAEIARVTQAAEDLGYDFVTCSEHVAVPVAAAGVRGATYWDPLADPRVSRRRHHPHPTGDVRAGARLPPPARDRQAVRHARRHQRRPTDPRSGRREPRRGVHHARRRVGDARRAAPTTRSRALRAALSQREPAYRGPYYEFGAMVIDPCAVQEHVPIWVGGRTGRSLRRAVTLADGWAPFGLRSAELAELLDRARRSEAWAERSTPLEVIVQNDRPLDPGRRTRSRHGAARQVPGPRRDLARGTARPPLPRPLLRPARDARRPRRSGMNGDRLDDQLAFLLEIDRLKLIERRSFVTDASRRENSAEHSWHLAMLALVLSEYAGDGIDSRACDRDGARARHRRDRCR